MATIVMADDGIAFDGSSPEQGPLGGAEAAFIEEVARRHPEAESKPIVIANCQAGWQTMMTAAIAPDLMGTIVVAGSPLSYWAGVHGKNPMRYSGGLLGGAWLTALSGDLGASKFDGAAKHRTEIGKRVFIGSNAALVAPVRIGDGAYVGTGSVITADVPEDALALARGRQVNKEGWAARLRSLIGAGRKPP